MDYKKSKAPTNTVTHNVMDFCQGTDNIYESVAIMSKRANQISSEIKEDLSKKLREFASSGDGLDDNSENREQIEISQYYERLPKATLMAADEFLHGRVYHRNPAKQKNLLDEDI
ncbi:MAG: DNA-directed RNA polymerase subunit omega [Bacteroidaceae bacterium]|nr:DNA-directed RNA polymerase subunit omega [Candidatus Equimonas faecalis]MCQ2205907.1 DNA-directed RNA polymerase subunit omega [Bacteroidaceae bacterium]